VRLNCLVTRTDLRSKLKNLARSSCLQNVVKSESRKKGKVERKKGVTEKEQKTESRFNGREKKGGKGQQVRENTEI